MGVLPDVFRLQLLLVTLAGRVIEYLVEENRVLKEQLGNRRLRLTEDQRRQLAAKGKILVHRALAPVATILAPGPTRLSAR